MTRCAALDLPAGDHFSDPVPGSESKPICGPDATILCWLGMRRACFIIIDPLEHRKNKG